MNNVEVTLALATAPGSAFAELRERPRFWFPLIVLAVTTAAVMFWYYTFVDVEWLKATVYSADPQMQTMPEAQREAGLAMLTRTTLLWSSVAGSLLGIPVIFLLSATYYLIAAKVTKLPFGFRHWFTFTCWTAMPLLLSSVVTAILMLLRDSAQVSPGALQPLSINELLLHRPPGSSGYNLLESLAIPSVLTWILAYIALRVWSQRSAAFCAIFVLLPSTVIYGVWAFFAFR